MSSYKIDYDQLRQTPEIKGLLSALERGFEKIGIDYYLVGAVARDVWMSGINNIAPRRTTADIDFAVLINDKGDYEALKEYLVSTEGFQPTKENAFVLLWKDRTEVDLMPFGAIEDEEAKVTIQGTGFTTLHVPGFAEVYEEGLPEVEVAEQHTFKFCSLPGIVVLKLLAWDDRPEVRRDDIKDISDILNHFFDMYDEEIWGNHFDLFGDEYIDTLHTAARVMGREVKKIARRNDKLFARITNIITNNTAAADSSKIAAIMTEHFENTVEDSLKLLLQIQKGLTE